MQYQAPIWPRGAGYHRSVLVPSRARWKSRERNKMSRTWERYRDTARRSFSVDVDRRDRGPMLAILALGGFIAIFLWAALTRGGYYSGADLLQRVDLLRVGPIRLPANNQLGDSINVIQPWLDWSRRQIRSGHLPLWNPYNGGGAPLLGNYQSAVFSPFSVPFYVLPFGVALVVAAFAKLFVAGIGTFAFLRRLGRSSGAALVGSVAFAFGGYQVFWLQWPHASVAVLLPVLMLCVEVFVTSTQSVAALRSAIALGLVTAAVLVAGHPETMFFVFAAVGGYGALRLLAERRERPAAKAIRATVAVIAALAGFALAAVQLLPFLEYWRRSNALTLRTYQSPVFLQMHLFALNAFPRLLGSPIDSYKGLLILTLTDGSYIGLIVLMLGGIGTISLWKDWSWSNAYFVLLASGWMLYAYNVLGFGRLLSRLPGFSVAHASRSDAVWVFSLAVLSAQGVDWLRARAQGAEVSDARAAARLLAPLLAGAASIAAVAYGLQRDLRASQHLGVTADAADRVARQSLVWIGVTFVAGVVVVSVIAVVRGRWISRCALAALAVVVFSQSGFYFRDYNPTVSARYFYPHTQLLSELRATTHNEMLLSTGTTAIAPEVNLWYGIPTPTEYDGLGVRDYEVVARRLLGYPSAVVIGGEKLGGFLADVPFLSASNPLDLAALRNMGVQWVTSATDYPWGILRSRQPLPNETPGWRALNVANNVGARLKTIGLTGNLVTIRTRGVSPGDMCRLVVRTPGGATSRARSMSQPCREGITTFPVAGVPSVGGILDLAFNGPAHVSIGVEPSGQAIAGLWSTRVFGLESVWDRQGVRLFSVPGAVDRFFSPARAERVSSADVTLSRLAAGDFDASQVVLLPSDQSLDSVGGNATVGRVQVVKSSPERIRLQVKRGQPGWVVGMQSYFPGWEATVNGRRAPIVRANYAFQAVRVPAGTSDVEFVYRPASVRHGGIISVLSALVFLILIGYVLVLRRRRSKRAFPIRA
jgi:hypothetical protein